MSVLIVFNSEGFRELLTSDGVQALVNLHAEEIRSRANSVPSTTDPAHSQPYYKLEPTFSEDRARTRVMSDGARAAAHESKTQALLGAL